MAFDAPGAYQYSFVADVDLSNSATNQFMAVAVGPSQQNVKGEGQGNTTIQAYAAGANFIGILQSCPKQGEAGTVMLRGISRCIAGGAWTSGQGLKVGANGALVAAGSGDATFATALESAVQGDTSSCLLH